MACPSPMLSRTDAPLASRADGTGTQSWRSGRSRFLAERRDRSLELAPDLCEQCLGRGVTEGAAPPDGLEGCGRFGENDATQVQGTALEAMCGMKKRRRVGGRHGRDDLLELALTLGDEGVHELAQEPVRR